MTQQNQRNAKAQPPPPQGFSLADVYYTLFRHWKLLFCCTLLGVAAAAAVYVFLPAPYVSEAKLLIRFVTDKRSPGPAEPNSSVSSPDSRGESIMASEEEIFESYDLALVVATNLQAAESSEPDQPRGRVFQKLLGGEGPAEANFLAASVSASNTANVSSNINASNSATSSKTPSVSSTGNAGVAARVRDLFTAASAIKGGIRVDVPKKSNVMRVLFKHRDGEAAQVVLGELVQAYFDKHKEIHLNPGVLDKFIQSQSTDADQKLRDVENELMELRSTNRIVSIDDTKKSLNDQITRIEEELTAARAQLAEGMAALGMQAPTPAPTNAAPTTNQVVPLATREEYQSLRADLDLLKKQKRQLLLEFTPENTKVKKVSDQVQDLEKQRKELETNYPQLAEMPVATASAQGGATKEPLWDAARVAAVQAGIVVLSNRLTELQKEIPELARAEMKMGQLQRKREIQEANFKYYQASGIQGKIDETLAGKVLNISYVQNPAAFRDKKSTQKFLAAALLGPIGFGLVLAFLMEMLLDRSVKRPAEVERRFRVPLFVAIPEQRGLNGQLKRRLLAQGKAAAVKAGDTPAEGAPDGTTVVLPPVLRSGDRLMPYFETLRDRLVNYFDLHEMTHKPKLVAITSCHKDAGATTIAAGLAASLSETGDGNVLLVDMNSEGGAAQHFFRGKPQMGLLDVLDDTKRADAQVQDKLYVVTEHETGGDLPRILPKRFFQLVPRLKLSDYDYIIFDMPQMSQTSITPRVARFMDMVLLVAEAEKTNVEAMQQATTMLTESGAHVGAVLNRVRNHVPNRLRGDLS